MIASISREANPPHPEVRRFNPWRDGHQVADLLEDAFREEMGLTGDSAGPMMVDLLRNFGPLESIVLRDSVSFVWEQDGRVLGHASVQRHPQRHATWVLGNVASARAHRGRGIGGAVVGAAVAHALEQPGARCVALQVLDGNATAQRLYARLGFHAAGAITKYRWSGASNWPAPEPATPTRAARLRDRAHVWACTRNTFSEPLTQAEVFDEGAYRLGVGWWLWNGLNGDRDAWRVTAHGAVRTRANIELREHTLDLLLLDGADADEAAALVRAGLVRLDGYVSRPVAAAASRAQPVAHAALQAAGFKPGQTFLHMLLRQD